MKIIEVNKINKNRYGEIFTPEYFVKEMFNLLMNEILHQDFLPLKSSNHL